MVFNTVFVLFVAACALSLCHSLPLAKVSIASFNSNGSAANAQYTYSQSSGRFHGKAYDGGYIDVTGCSGAQGSCRNNPRCQCDRDVGPLPRATCVVKIFDCAFLFCSQLPAATPLGPRLSSRAWPLATNCIRIQETCAGGPAFSFMVAIAAATPARAALSFRTPPRAIASSTVPSLKLRSRVIARAAFAHKHASHSLFAPAPCLCASALVQ